MVHVHTQKPNEPSLGAGAHVHLGLTPIKSNRLDLTSSLLPSARCEQVCVVPKSAGFSIPDSKPWALPGDKCRPVWVGGLLNYYLIPASSHICHGARPHPKPE